MSLNGPLATDETETAATLETRATPRPCAQCQEPFTSKRADARYCSPGCRLKAHRGAPKAQQATGATPKPAPSTANSSNVITIKPQRSKRGGHKPGGSERYQEAKQEALADIAYRLQPRTKKPAVPYSDEIANTIIERLEQGEALHAICSTDDMPSHAAVHKWAAEMPSTFGDRYVRARELGYLKLADELDQLAAGLDVGERRFESGVVARHRLQVEQRRWMLSKMLPKVFGDRVDVTTAGKPIQASLPDLELARRALHWIGSLKSQDVVDAEVVAVEDKSGEGETS